MAYFPTGRKKRRLERKTAKNFLRIKSLKHQKAAIEKAIEHYTKKQCSKDRNNQGIAEEYQNLFLEKFNEFQPPVDVYPSATNISENWFSNNASTVLDFSAPNVVHYQDNLSMKTLTLSDPLSNSSRNRSTPDSMDNQGEEPNLQDVIEIGVTEDEEEREDESEGEEVSEEDDKESDLSDEPTVIEEDCQISKSTRKIAMPIKKRKRMRQLQYPKEEVKPAMMVELIGASFPVFDLPTSRDSFLSRKFRYSI